jgi:surfeit locus 1 family protein
MLCAAFRHGHFARLRLQRGSRTSSLQFLPCAQVTKYALHGGAFQKPQIIQSFEPLPTVKKSSFSTSTAPPSSSSLFSRLAGIILFGTVSVFLFYLGGWQLHRSKWKKRIIEERQVQLSKPIVSAQDVLEGTESPFYRRVKLRGRLNYEQQVLVGPRSPPFAVAAQHSGHAGYWIITPMTLESGQCILVNRGWVPSQFPVEQLREAEVDGVVELEGVLRRTEAPPKYLLEFLKRPSTSDSSNESAKNKNLHFIDGPVIYSQIGIPVRGVPLIGDVLSAAPDNASKLPLRKTDADYLKFTITPAIHYAYAFTWYALSAVLFVLTILRFRGRTFRQARAALKSAKP